MNISKNSQWDENQIIEFLESTEFPVRLSFLNKSNEPQICSLWYQFDHGAIWAASHKNSYLVNQLKHNNKVAFEISSNEYPYKGVRGKGEIELSTKNSDALLRALISKYLGNTNSQLSSWLLSRTDDEYVIKINPALVNSWDFSDRMEK